MGNMSHTDDTVQSEVYEEIFDLTGEGILITDQNSIIKNVNASGAEIFGYSVDELLSRSMSELLPKSFRHRHEDYLRNSVIIAKTVVNKNRSVEGLRKDGSMFPVEVNISPIMIDGARHYVGVFRDITERARAEMMSRRQSKSSSIARLTSGITHDFNNLLAIIVGNLDLLLEQPLDNSSRDMLQTIDRTVSRATRLTARLREFSRPINETVEHIFPSDCLLYVEDLLPAAEREKCEIVIEVQADTWPVLVNRSDFESALMSLIMNGLDSMDEGGQLTVSCRNEALGNWKPAEQSSIPPGDYVVCAVSDTGCGITPEHRDLIFDPFFSTKYVGEGTGLGLPGVFGFVSRSKGYITLQTETGHGSTFEIYLPRNKD